MIDTHAHLGKVMYDPLTPEEHYCYTTEMALQDCEKYPDRLIPFANIDPRRGSNDGNLDFYPIIKEYADRGCKGFGEILANLPTNDKRLKNVSLEKMPRNF